MSLFTTVNLSTQQDTDLEDADSNSEDTDPEHTDPEDTDPITEDAEPAGNEQFLPVVTLASSLTTVIFLFVFDFPVYGGILQPVEGIPNNQTMFYLYRVFADIVSRQYGIGMRDAWMVAKQSIAVVNTYPFTLPANFASEHTELFLRKRKQRAEAITKYINDVCKILRPLQVAHFGVNANDFSKEHSLFPPEMIAQVGNIIHTSKFAIGGVLRREIVEFYAAINCGLARTLHVHPKSFTKEDAFSIGWSTSLSAKFTKGSDVYVYVATDEDGNIIFWSQNRTAFEKDIKEFVSIGSKKFPPQEKILNNEDTSFVCLKIRLVKYEDIFLRNEDISAKFFGPQASPEIIAAWKAQVIEERQSDIQQEVDDALEGADVVGAVGRQINR